MYLEPVETVIDSLRELISRSDLFTGIAFQRLFTSGFLQTLPSPTPPPERNSMEKTQTDQAPTNALTASRDLRERTSSVAAELIFERQTPKPI